MFRATCACLLAMLVLDVAHSSLLGKKSKWHAVVLGLAPCRGSGGESGEGTPQLPVSAASLRARRLGEYSTLLMGDLRVHQLLGAPFKLVAFTYEELPGGGTVTKLSVSYEDACAFVGDASNPFVKPLLQGSDLPSACPIEPGKYHINATYLLEGEYQGVVPEGIIHAEVHGFLNDQLAFCIRSTVEMSTSN